MENNWIGSPIRKNFLTVRAVQEWNQLPQELVSAPTLEAFRKNLDNHVADMLCIPALSRGLDLMAL